MSVPQSAAQGSASKLLQQLDQWCSLVESVRQGAPGIHDLDALVERRSSLGQAIGDSLSIIVQDWEPGDQRRRQLKHDVDQRLEKIREKEKELADFYQLDLSRMRLRLRSLGKTRKAIGGYRLPKQPAPRRIDTSS